MLARRQKEAVARVKRSFDQFLRGGCAILSACALPAHTLHTSSNSDGAGTHRALKKLDARLWCRCASVHTHMGSPPCTLNVNPRALCAHDAHLETAPPPPHARVQSPQSFCQRAVRERGPQRFTSAARTTPISFFIAPPREVRRRAGVAGIITAGGA